MTSLQTSKLRPGSFRGSARAEAQTYGRRVSAVCPVACADALHIPPKR